MLVNAEMGGVMVIDFERALLLEQARQPLAHVVPNKRGREETRADKTLVDRGSKRKQGFINELSEAKAIFTR